VELQGKHILVIDDEPLMCQLVKSIFTNEGSIVTTALSGREGLRKLGERKPDLILLDILMPGESGWEICQRIRDFSKVPVIMLTARSGGEDEVRGLDVGADDYVTKPFDRDVLVARSKAVLRRIEAKVVDGEPSNYDDGYLAVDLLAHRVRINGNPIRLSATEYNLLAHLLRNAGRVCTFSNILESVWGEQYRYSDEYVHVYIWHLRRKLEPNPKKPVYLISEHSVGYRFDQFKPA
jgi:DNA-binding response OmpR family regulator